MQAVHTCTGPGHLAVVNNGVVLPRAESRPVAVDGCAVPPGDGDPDLGLGGGIFPAGSCAPPGWGPGAAYAATDGPVVPGMPCVGNGIVTDNPLTDPGGCGSGAVGVVGRTIAFHSTPATGLIWG